MQRSVVFLGTFLAALAALTAGCTVKILVALPFHESADLTTNWERGCDILPGAQIAVENINDVSDCKVQLTAVNGGKCGANIGNHFYFLENFVSKIRSLSVNESLAAVGLLCNSAEFQFIPPISLESVRLKLPLPLSFPNVVKPAMPWIEILFKFMNTLKWHKLGVVSETKDSYFSRSAEALYRNAKLSPDIDIIRYQGVDEHSRIKLIQNSIAKISVLSASPQVTLSMLCSAHHHDLVWPKRVWILHSYALEDIVNLEAPCIMKAALENVLFIREQAADEIINSSIDVFGMKYQDLVKLPNNGVANPYSIKLHNLIWMLTQHQRVNLTYIASIYNPGFKITQFRNNSEITIATISKGNIITFTDDEFLKLSISDELEVKFEGAPNSYTIIFSTGITIGFIFVTFIFICYIHFRNEPEVKSTSFTLSLLIFLGCYLNLFFVSLLLYLDQPIRSPDYTLDAICGAIPWLSGLGLSTSIILVTTLVKLARVYHLFHRFTPKPLGIKSSDIFLVMYVLIILLPQIVILAVWASLDRFKITYRPAPRVELIQKLCLSDYLQIWIPLLVLYLAIILLVLTTVAIMSRNIREKHFKETKSVNLFIFLTSV